MGWSYNSGWGDGIPHRYKASNGGSQANEIKEEELTMVSQKSEKQEKLLAELQSISGQMAKGGQEGIEGLYELRELIGTSREEKPYGLLSLSREIDSKPLVVIWVLGEFLNEIWCNFSGDATGFPKKETQRVAEISQLLAAFIQTSLFGGEGDPIEILGRVIETYAGLVQVTDEELMTRGRSKEFVVL